MHRKISQTMQNFAWCAKFIFFLHLVVSQGVRNCPSLSPIVAPPLDFACYAKFSHRHAKLNILDFFPTSLIGLATYCQAWKRAMKCSKARILHVFELQLALPLISQDSSSSWLVSMIKKLPKTPKLAKNWLVTLARFLNVPIELKCINYYSKVFKIVSFKL